MPLCKVLVDFHLENCCAKFQSRCCRRTLQRPRICSKWQLKLILGNGAQSSALSFGGMFAACHGGETDQMRDLSDKNLERGEWS